MTTYQDAWDELLGAISGWKRQLLDADMQDAPEIKIYDTVLELMSYIEAKISDVPSGLTTSCGPQVPVEDYGFSAPSLETLRQWAQAALPGAPAELQDFAARICWSVLNGGNPAPEERIVDVEAIGFLAGALDHADEFGGSNDQLGVSSGSIDPVL